MATILIRNLDDMVAERLRVRLASVGYRWRRRLVGSA
jgi:plasmid stability protein